MSSERAWTFRLSHALRAIEKILRYTADLSEESFRLDERTVDAVIRNFQVMGEAIRHVPPEFRKSHPELPWSSMEKMRHVLVHDYDKVDISILWQTIQQDLPPLLEPLRALIDEVRGS